MSKPGLAAALVAVALLAVPAVSADGATEQPPVLFTRIAVDDDGQLAPGSCAAAQQSCAQDPLGLDVVSLDVREARDANNTHVVIFLVGFQSDNPDQAGKVEISVTVNGTAKLLDVSGAFSGTFNSTTCDRVRGAFQFPGADEHVKAVECHATLASLGANATGAQLTGITVTSFVGTKKYDVVPGTWYASDAQGNRVPYVPCEVPSGATVPTCDPAKTDPAGGPTAGFTYTLQGPADLLVVEVEPDFVNLARGTGNVEIRLTAAVTNSTQEVTLTMDAPAAVQASLDAATVVVDNGTRTVGLTVVGATRDSLIVITITSDVGAYHQVTIPVAAPPRETCAPGSNATTCPPPTTTTTTQESPAPALFTPLAGLLGLALLRRRGT